MVAKDSDGEDSSGEPKRARFLDVFIAHKLQTQERMGLVRRDGKNYPLNSASALRGFKVFHSSKHKLSISGINSHIGQLHKNQRKMHVHRLADPFGAVSLSLDCSAWKLARRAVEPAIGSITVRRL